MCTSPVSRVSGRRGEVVDIIFDVKRLSVGAVDIIFDVKSLSVCSLKAAGDWRRKTTTFLRDLTLCARPKHVEAYMELLSHESTRGNAETTRTYEEQAQ